MFDLTLFDLTPSLLGSILFYFRLITIGLVNMKTTPNVQILKNGGDDHIPKVFLAQKKLSTWSAFYSYEIVKKKNL